MLNTMCHDSVDRAAFKRERSADRQQIFDPFRSFVSAMRKQPVIAHADAQTLKPTIKNMPQPELST